MSDTPYRQTYVVEYPNAAAAPRVGAQEVLGGKLVAAQFSDALAEIDTLERELTAARAEVEALRETWRINSDAFAAKEAEAAALREFAQSLIDGYESEWGMDEPKYIVRAARAALAKENAS